MGTSLGNLVRAILFSVVALAASQAQAAITLSIEMNPNPVRPGEVLVAELTVANNGGAPVNTVTLQATIPAGVSSFTAAYITGGATCTIVVNNGLCDPGEIANWTLGTIPAGGSVTVSLPLFVAAATAAGTTITLPGTAFVNAVSTATTNASAVVSTTNALSLSVDEDKDRVVPGEQLTYTLVYGNRAASSSVTGTTLSFPIPAGTTFVSATGGGTFSAGSVNWTLGSLPATQSSRQQVVVSVNGGLAAGSVLSVDAATITGSGGVPESASATAVTRVAASAPLVLAVEFNPDPVRPNEQGVAQLTVSNRGGVALTGVVLQARVPAALTSFGVTYATGGATCIVAFNDGLCNSIELMNWALGTLPAGGSITVSIPVFVPSAAIAGRLINLETLANDDSNNRAVIGSTVAIDSDAPLSLAVDEDKDRVTPGELLTYTLTYGNRAASISITGTALSFPVPAGTTFVSASGGGTLSGSNVSWVLGSLPATQSGRQQVVVSVNGGLTAGSVLPVNGAVIAGQNSSLIEESTRATAVTRVASSAPLVLAVEVNPDPVRPNEQGIAQLTVSNRSGAALTGVVLQARIPTVVSNFDEPYVTEGGICIVAFNDGLCNSGEILNWTLGTVPAGGSVTVSVPMFVASATTPGRLLILEALANDDGNNRAAMGTTVAVDSDGPLSLAVDEDKDRVATGELLTYTLTYGNRAASSNVTGTTLTLPVPAGTTFVSATGGGTLSGSTVSWTLGSLAATQSGRQQVLVAVNGGLAAGTALNVNGALISGLNSSLVTESARATAVTRVATSPPLVLAVEFNPDPARPNETGSARLTVSNRSGAPLTGVVLQARVPVSLNSFNASYLTGGGTCIVAFNDGLCNSAELLNWAIGTIPAGTGVTVALPVFVASAATVGRLLVLEAMAKDDSNNRAVTESSIAVDLDNPLTLSITDDVDAVPNGGLLKYTLTYGNRATTGNVTGTTLSFPLPVEAVLVGSSGGTIVGSNIVWNIGSLAAGAGGRRTVTLSVPGAVTNGTVIRINAAELTGNIVAGVVPDAERATATTRVEASKPLALSMSLAPDPVVATQTLTATLTVTNNSGGTLTGLVLQARVPPTVNSFNPTLLTGGGTCIIAFNDGLCNSGELANWNLGTLANGASAVVTMPMVVTSGTVNGRLITVESRVADDGGKLATMERTVLLNPFTDTDGDGVAQIFDNCTTKSNASQCDSDSDGYGNHCDGDFGNPAPGNNFTNAQDTAILRQQLGLPSVAPLFNKADLNCNGFVNSQDTTLFRQLLGFPPGPSALAP